jgi:hypothetical protein
MITYNNAPVQRICDLIYNHLVFLRNLSARAAACVCSRGYVNGSRGWICPHLASPVGCGVAIAAADPATSWDDPASPPLVRRDCCAPPLTPGSGEPLGEDWGPPLAPGSCEALGYAPSVAPGSYEPPSCVPAPAPS